SVRGPRDRAGPRPARAGVRARAPQGVPGRLVLERGAPLPALPDRVRVLRARDALPGSVQVVAGRRGPRLAAPSLVPDDGRHRFLLTAMAFVYHIELTDICDLDCSYCALTHSTRRKGHMSEATYRKVVAHMEKSSPLNFMILHHFGEPLLHPALARFVQIASRARLNPGFSTNGQGLSRARFEELVRHGLTWMCIVFHTLRGRAAYEELRDVAREHGVVLWGRELTPSAQDYDVGAVLDYGIERQLLHTFAGAVGPAEVRPPGWR